MWTDFIDILNSNPYFISKHKSPITITINIAGNAVRLLLILKDWNPTETKTFIIYHDESVFSCVLSPESWVILFSVLCSLFYCLLFPFSGEAGIRTQGKSFCSYIRLAGERLRPTRPPLPVMRRTRDSNPHGHAPGGFQDRCLTN